MLLFRLYMFIYFPEYTLRRLVYVYFRKDVRLPIQLQRAMAAEAEAAREARAKVIAAEGEQKASRALREASEVIGDSPAALQLRYLQVKDGCALQRLGMCLLHRLYFPLVHQFVTHTYVELSSSVESFSRQFLACS